MVSPSIKPTLGRLEKINVRTYWEREDIDFTPWLAEPENIQLLGEAIGVDLDVEAQEKEVGPFRADILCKDTVAENLVLIENQLERTDHIHLGQILTYAAGLHAVTIIWIAARFTDEHRATLDWLNDITTEDINLFGLEIELWKIGESAIAPKFNIISSPNDWSKTVTGAAKRVANSDQSEIKQLLFEYWRAFREYAIEHADLITPTKALYQHWMNIAIGRSGFKLMAVASTWNSELESWDSDEIRAELYISRRSYPSECKHYFDLLQRQQIAVETELGEPLIWDSQPDRKACRIYLRRSIDLNNRDNWPAQHQWLTEKLDKMHHVFSHRVKQLTLDDLSLMVLEDA